MEDKRLARHEYIKRIAAILSFVIVIFTSLAFLQKYLCIPYNPDQNRIIMYHKEPRDSIDVLLIGSSATYSGFSSVYAYEEFGFTSFPYALGGATCTSWKPALQDALRTQNPKLIVVDVFGGGYDQSIIERRNHQFYTIMSHTPLSREKIETAREMSNKVNNTSTFSLLFPIVKYHNSIPRNLRTARYCIGAYHSDPSKLKGVEIITRTRSLAAVDSSSFSDESVSLDKEAESVITDFMQYCRDNDLNMLFVKYPTVLTKNDPDELLVNLRANRILEMAREYGFATLNMQKSFHEIGLIEKEDFYNHGHTNTRGQKKVTDFLGAYIQNNISAQASAPEELNNKTWDDCIPYYHAYCDLAEELISQEKQVPFADSPSLTTVLESIISGAEVKAVAKDYKKRN